MIRAVAIVLLALSGCRDEEQRARAVGEAARAEVAVGCASAQPAVRSPAPTMPDDDGAEADAERTGCARRGCEPPCASFVAQPAFHRACMTSCTADAECRTDADCGRALRCIAVAPRVRRCRPTPTSHTPATGSAP